MTKNKTKNTIPLFTKEMLDNDPYGFIRNIRHIKHETSYTINWKDFIVLIYHKIWKFLDMKLWLSLTKVERKNIKDEINKKQSPLIKIYKLIPSDKENTLEYQNIYNQNDILLYSNLKLEYKVITDKEYDNILERIDISNKIIKC